MPKTFNKIIINNGIPNNHKSIILVINTPYLIGLEFNNHLELRVDYPHLILQESESSFFQSIFFPED